jgi:hypothetical protein
MSYIYKKVDLPLLDMESLSLQEIAQYALREFLNKRRNTDRVFIKNKSICVKAFNENSVYPEIKERESSQKANFYVLAVVNRKEKAVYLEGWCSQDDLVQDKNKSKDVYYLSYKDLKPINELS